MKCSVVIPVFNREKLIVRSVQSVLNQTVKDIEVIVVDDCSTDNTKDVVKEMQKADSRIRLIETPVNGGPAKARNTGVREAESDIIAFLDSDDYWLDDKLEKELSYKEQTQADLVCTSSFVEDENGIRQNKIFLAPRTLDLKTLLKGNDVINSSVIVSRSLLEKHPFVSGNIHEDYAFLITILRDGAKICGITEPLTVYCSHKQSITGNKIKSMIMTRNTYKYLNIKFIRRNLLIFDNVIHGLKKHFFNHL